MLMNALSVDVEEYYHSLEFEAAVPEDQRSHLPTRVEESMDRVLALLDPLRIRATFFIVGQVAEAHPAMVKKIDKAAHEIACHSYRHDLVSRQSPQEFREDVRRAKTILEDLSGKAVIGYRAPNYSIGQDQSWAYDVLLEEGFLYDSSIYPILHDRYGCVNAPRFPYDIRDNGGQKLIEFPVGTTRWFGVNLPIGGGGYFRRDGAARHRAGPGGSRSGAEGSRVQASEVRRVHGLRRRCGAYARVRNPAEAVAECGGWFGGNGWSPYSQTAGMTFLSF